MAWLLRQQWFCSIHWRLDPSPSGDSERFRGLCCSVQGQSCWWDAHLHPQSRECQICCSAHGSDLQPWLSPRQRIKCQSIWCRLNCAENRSVRNTWRLSLGHNCYWRALFWRRSVLQKSLTWPWKCLSQRSSSQLVSASWILPILTQLSHMDSSQALVSQSSMQWFTPQYQGSVVSQCRQFQISSPFFSSSLMILDVSC